MLWQVVIAAFQVVQPYVGAKCGGVKVPHDCYIAKEGRGNIPVESLYGWLSKL